MRQRLLEGLPPTVREIQEFFGFRAVQTVQEHLRRLVAEGRLVKLKGKARGYSLPPGETFGQPTAMLVPIIGRVHAGDLNTAIEECEGYVPVLARGIQKVNRARAGFAVPRGAAGDSAHAGDPMPDGAEAGTRRGQRPRTTGAGLITTCHNISPVDPTQPTGSGQLFALRVQGESMTGAGILPGDIAIVRSQPTANSGDIVVALIDDEATVKRLRIRRGRIELHPENPDYKPIVPEPDECVILGKVIETRRYVEPLTF